MKGTTLRFIVIVIVPAFLLIGIAIYFIFRIPQVRYGFGKYIADYSIDRSVRKGNISQASAILIKKAVNRLFEAQIKVDNSGIDRKKIEKEIEELAKSKKIQRGWTVFGEDILTDDEAKKLVNFLNEIAQIMEKAAENYSAKSK